MDGTGPRISHSSSQTVIVVNDVKELYTSSPESSFLITEIETRNAAGSHQSLFILLLGQK